MKSYCMATPLSHSLTHTHKHTTRYEPSSPRAVSLLCVNTNGHKYWYCIRITFFFFPYVLNLTRPSMNPLCLFLRVQA